MRTITLIAILVSAFQLFAFTTPFSVKNESGVALTNAVVSSGVPVPLGAVRGVAINAMAPVSISGVDGQYKVLAIWPDGSVKWVLCTFMESSFAAGQTRTYTLGDGSGNCAAKSLSVSQDGSKVTVNTGVVTFEILKGNAFNGFNSILLNGAQMVNPANSKLVIVGSEGADAGVEFIGRADSVVVMENGPIRAMVGVHGYFNGFYDNYNGGTRTKTVRFIMYVYAYNNSGEIKVSFTLWNSNKSGFYNEDLGAPYTGANTVYIRGLNLELGLANLSATPAIRSDNHSLTLGSGNRYTLLSHNVAGPPMTGQDAFVTYHKTNGVVTDSMGSWASPMLDKGFLDIHSGTRGVTVNFNHFWQQNPKEYTVKADLLRLGLWPDTLLPGMNAAHNWKYQDWTGTYTVTGITTRYELVGGVRKTFEFFFNFYEGAAPLPIALAGRAASCESPLFARCEDTLYRSLRLFASFAPWNVSVAPGAADSANYAKAIYRNQVLRKAIVDTNAIIDGTFRWSGGPIRNHDLESYRRTKAVHQMDVLTLYGWREFGDIDWAQPGFSNLHYDWPMIELMNYLRSGDYRFMREALKMVPHARDIDWYYYVDARGVNQGLQRFEFARHDAVMSSPKTTHAWIEGLTTWYCLTGDPLARETHDWMLKGLRTVYLQDYMGYNANLTKIVNNSYEIRGESWPLMMLLSLYENLHVDSALILAKTLWSNSLWPTFQASGFSLPGQAQCLMINYASQGLIKYHTYLKRFEPESPAVSQIEQWFATAADTLRHNTYGGYLRSSRWIPRSLPFMYTSADPNTDAYTIYSFKASDLFAYCYKFETDPVKKGLYLQDMRAYFTDGQLHFWGGFKPSGETSYTGYTPDSADGLRFKYIAMSGTEMKVLSYMQRYGQQVLDVEYNLATNGPPFFEAANIAITTHSLDTAVKDTAYAFQMQRAGGQAPFTWTRVSGSFPNGLSISSSGLISGTTADTGNFTVRVCVTDSKTPVATTDSATLVLRVLAVTPRPPIGQVNVLQNGLNGYSGCEDILLSSATTTNLEGQGLLVGSKNNNPNGHSLIRFDLSAFPTTQTVVRCTLMLRCFDAGLKATDISVFKVMRPWVETEATRIKARSTVDWTTAYAVGHGTDIDTTVKVNLTLPFATGWHAIDVTAMVQDFITNPTSNRGFLLDFYTRTGGFWGYGGYDQKEYRDAEYTIAAERPKLIVCLPPSSVEEALRAPGDFELNQNVPNPFNPVTQISYGIPRKAGQKCQVTLSIYNVRGTLIATLKDGIQGPGYHQVSWAGTDAPGKKVPSGLYVYRITMRGLQTDVMFTSVKKMLMVK